MMWLNGLIICSFEYWFHVDRMGKDQEEQIIAEEKERNVLAMLHQVKQ